MSSASHPAPLIRTLGLAALLSSLSVVSPPDARGDSIPLTADLDARAEGLASFAGTLSLAVVDDRTASLVVELTNTTPAPAGGFLTGFFLNNPGDAITGLSMTAAPAHFVAALGDDDRAMQPFGRFDIEVSLTPGAPKRGVGVGQSGRFELALSGSGFTGLTASSFLGSLSDSASEGHGAKSFVARFQSIALGAGSDKVPALIPGLPPPPDDDDPTGGPGVVPEPASVLSLAAGLVGAGLLARRRRRGR
jgi:hypothetical protein